MSEHNNETLAVPVLFDYHHADEFVAATFVWPEESNEVYTMAPTRYLSLGLDQHFPVRMHRLRLFAKGERDARHHVKGLCGEEFAEAIHHAPNVGSFTMEVLFNRERRLYLAGLQLKDPSSPPAIRHACQAMLSHQQSNER